jgi:hypothetical protein
MQDSATPITKENSPISLAIRQMTESVCGRPVVKEKKKGFRFFSL